MSEELIKRLNRQVIELAEDGYLHASDLLREAADALSRPAPDAGRVAELEAQLAVERSAYEVRELLVKAGHEHIAALEAQLAASREREGRLRSLAADVCLASGYENARQAVIALNTELMRLNQADAAIAAEKEQREKCPDCGRLKSRNADDAMRGDCDKWYAVRDKEAHEECARIAATVATEAVAQDYDIAQLMKFYSVTDLVSLVRIQSEHVARLQKKLPPMRDEQPRNPRSGGE